MINSVSIDGKDMYTEYGCILAKTKIGQPEVQTKYVSVPLRDGLIDLSETLTDIPKYNDREIQLTFIYLGDNKPLTISKIARDVHGRKLKIIFDDDKSFYYLGRISIDAVETYGKADKIVLKAECDPFKYDITASDIDWEWDVFDFEDGIINEAGQIVVDGTKSFTLVCRRQREFPIFTASTAMQMVFKNKTYNLKAGEQKLYRVFFDEGENPITFKGNGTVSIKYIGGSL